MYGRFGLVANTSRHPLRKLAVVAPCKQVSYESVRYVCDIGGTESNRLDSVCDLRQECAYNGMNTEADTCRKYVVPESYLALGWDSEPHSIAEQRTVTDGRAIPVGKEGFVRKPPKRVDFLFRYTRDFPLAVVEAKASYKIAADAVQQARIGGDAWP